MSENAQKGLILAKQGNIALHAEAVFEFPIKRDISHALPFEDDKFNALVNCFMMDLIDTLEV